MASFPPHSIHLFFAKNNELTNIPQMFIIKYCDKQRGR